MRAGAGGGSSRETRDLRPGRVLGPRHVHTPRGRDVRAARAAVDVALTAADLVLDGGATSVYGLCRPPGHHAARSMYGGYCFFNNAAIAAESIVRPTASASRSSTSTITTATAPSRSSGVAATCSTSRSTPIPTGSTRTTSAGPTRPARGRAPARTSTCRCRPARRRALPRGPRPGARGDRGDAGLGRRRLARLRHLRPRPDLRLRPDDRRLSRDRPPGGRARAPARRSSRRAATTGRRSARTPGPGCAAPRVGRSITCPRPARARRARERRAGPPPASATEPALPSAA